MKAHHCHALGCDNPCPPKWLMCGDCWAQVPKSLQDDVYRTVKLRAKVVNASWAAWWRAQAKAIAHIAFLKEPNTIKRDAYLQREMAFAAKLEVAVGPHE